MKNFLNIFFFALFCSIVASSQNIVSVNYKTVTAADVKVGAQRTAQYFPLLKGRNIAVVANQTSMIGKTHLVDRKLPIPLIPKPDFRLYHYTERITNSNQPISKELMCCCLICRM
jgi:hypothetical protein